MLRVSFGAVAEGFVVLWGPPSAAAGFGASRPCTVHTRGPFALLSAGMQVAEKALSCLLEGLRNLWRSHM